MTTSLEIEPVMNMSNSAEMTTVGGGRAASNSFGAAAMRCELRPYELAFETKWVNTEEKSRAC